MRVLGIILLAFCTACVGFIKASKLEKRHKILRDLLISFGEAQQRIKLRQEKNIIIEKLFEPPFVLHKKSPLEIKVYCPHLLPQDNAFLNEFAQGLGMGDLNSQTEFLDIHKELLKGRIAEAKEEHCRKAGMYRTCCVLAAIAVVILLI